MKTRDADGVDWVQAKDGVDWMEEGERGVANWGAQGQLLLL